MASDSRESKVYYVTTPIYYVTARPHIGTTYTTVAADAVARYQRMRGREVLFLTGSDEHAQKVVRAAQAAGLDAKAFTDRVVTSYLEAWDRMKVSYDRFIRTSEDEHKEVVTHVFARLLESGDIYKDRYEGWYCVPCETYFPEDELLEGNLCPDCQREVEVLTEEAYFFRASAQGSTMFPRDLLILSPAALIHQPCANSISGNSTPNAMSIASHMLPWKRVRMSLPMSCRSGGHRRAHFSSSTL